jgi:hypothetical protein
MLSVGLVINQAKRVLYVPIRPHPCSFPSKFRHGDHIPKEYDRIVLSVLELDCQFKKSDEYMLK